MKVIFSHGKESGPWGTKIQALAKIAEKHGHTVDSIDYTDLADPDERANRLANYLQNEKDEFILVGSSMGGYVSLVGADLQKTKAVFLLAPALYLNGYQKQNYSTNCKNVEIIHGWEDEVIPFENSVKFAKEANCSLHLIAGDHRLNTSLDMVKSLFERFIISLKKEN